jgi:ribosomal protein S18 acetylase RimI-like enzyme
MPLPVLHSRGEVRAEDLVRLYHRTELHYTRHLAEELVLDIGTAFYNCELPGIWLANRVLDAALPDGMLPAEAVSAVDTAFAEQGVPCSQWLLNPAAPVARTAPLAEYLVATGWAVESADILCLTGTPSGLVRQAPGLTIIPARASFRHTRQVAEESAARWGEPQVADAHMLHLDDPHWDALLAIKDGTAVGYAGVLAVGDLGRIDQVFVATDHRRQGIGRTLMSRAMEICVRSQFRQVMLAVAPDNIAAQALYGQLGFRKIGQLVAYQRRDRLSVT